MTTCVEKYTRAVLGILEVLQETLKVKTLGFFIEVAILSYFHPHVFKNLVVVGPGRVTYVDRRDLSRDRVGRRVHLKELTDDPQGSSTTQSL